ncbi:MAG: hypothetical protein JSV56_12825 [Methanomassiliicoccales archaeon]|nr:MAG: hypothetical protein JSV56_12825 [Methanomassiliicoccales archaeon]
MKEIQIKVIVAGEPGSGKSIISEVNDACISLKGLGVSIGLKTLEDEETQCCMTFITWTLAEGRPKDTSYIQGSKAAVIVCDLTKGKTVKKMKKWAKSIKKGIGEVPFIFVGNNVDTAEGSEVDLMLNYAKKYDAPVVLTRLSDRASIEEVFVQIVKVIGPGLLE